jgi:SAM-dependent methyltransferase
VNLLNDIRVRATVLFDAPSLFDRLFRQDWYGGVLRGWADGLITGSMDRVLETGCGPGNLSRHLSARGLNVTGADRSQKMLDRAAKTESAARFICGDATALPLPAGGFDLCLSASLVNVLPDGGALVREMARLCAPGGTVSVLFPLDGFTPAFARDFARRHRLDGYSTAAIGLWAGKAGKLSVPAVRTMFDKAGLRDIRDADFIDGGLAAVSGRLQ